VRATTEGRDAPLQVEAGNDPLDLKAGFAIMNQDCP